MFPTQLSTTALAVSLIPSFWAYYTIFPQLLRCVAVPSGMHHCKEGERRGRDKAGEGWGFMYLASLCFGILWSHFCACWLSAVGRMWHHAGSLLRPGSGCQAKEVTHYEMKLGFLSVCVCVCVCVFQFGWGLAACWWRHQSSWLIWFHIAAFNQHHFKVAQHAKYNTANGLMTEKCYTRYVAG